MSLQIINSSPLRQSAIIGNTNTLFIEATSTYTPLSYTWYEVNKNNNVSTLILGANTSTYITPTTATLANVYKAVVTDSQNNVSYKEFIFDGNARWFDGVNPDNQLIAMPGAMMPVAVSNNIRGSLHIYDSYFELTNATINYQKITYGQIVLVLHDTPLLVDGVIQKQTQINKYYKCNVHEPYTRKHIFNTVDLVLWGAGRKNAKYWDIDYDSNYGFGAAAAPIMDSNNYMTGVQITDPGLYYSYGDNLFVGIATDDNVNVDAANITIADISNDDGSILSITINPIGPFTTPPTIVIIGGSYTINNYPPEPTFEWTIGDSDAYDWQGVTFLNAEPDNDTIIIENGLVKATAVAGNETTWTKTDPAKAVFTPTLKMSALEGLYGIEVLEKAVYPYQPVTLSLTAQNVGSVNTELLNEVSTSITIRNIHVYADNFENICANTLGASSITLSAITSDGIQSIITSLGSITKTSLMQGVGNLIVNIDKTGLNQNHTITIIAAATESGENDDQTHVVTASTQIQWCYNKYYLKDSNPTVSDTITIPNSAGRELSFVPQGSYDFPYTATPQYLWILLPTHMSVNHIGTADQSVPFYSDAGNNLITTIITIGRNGQSQSYKGYRSYWPTAADYTVTI